MKKCVCGNGKSIKVVHVKERMINNGEEFRYGVCRECGTIFLLDEVTEDEMSRYYGKNYYSFETVSRESLYDERTANTLANRIIINTFWGASFDGFISRLFRKKVLLTNLRGTKIRRQSKILDVGGGNGSLINDLKLLGYKYGVAIDRYCEKSPYDIRFMNTSLLDMDEKNEYELIMMNNSFEHMNNPKEILKKTTGLLQEKGMLVVKIPLGNCKAYKEYGTDWYQIDAPRHYYLYTVKAIKLMCEEVGLKVKKVVYTGGVNQFLISEQYRETSKGYWDIQKEEVFRKLSKRQKVKLWVKSIVCNLTGTSDSATFYIEKK